MDLSTLYPQFSLWIEFDTVWYAYGVGAPAQAQPPRRRVMQSVFYLPEFFFFRFIPMKRKKRKIQDKNLKKLLFLKRFKDAKFS